MLTRTSEQALRALVYLGQFGGRGPVPPRVIAAAVNSSPTYMAKITRSLVKAGILRPFRGAQGGITLEKSAKDVRLLDVVEACQGKLLIDYCQGGIDCGKVCAYHAAMAELHEGMVKVLSKWTLQDLIDRPRPKINVHEDGVCRLSGGTVFAMPQAPGAPPIAVGTNGARLRR